MARSWQISALRSRTASSGGDWTTALSLAPTWIVGLLRETYAVGARVVREFRIGVSVLLLVLKLCVIIGLLALPAVFRTIAASHQTSGPWEVVQRLLVGLLFLQPV